MNYEILGQIILLLAASLVVLMVFKRLRVPPLLGYVAVGMVLGPNLVGLIPDAEGTRFLAEFGVVFLLFTLGLEFSWPRMIAMRRDVFGLGAAQVMVTTALVTLCLVLLDVPAPVAVILGGVVAMSSTAIVVSQLGDQLELSRTHGRKAVAILLFQDLAVVPFLAMVPLLAADASDFSGAAVAAALLEAVGMLVLVLLVGRFLLRPAFHQLAVTRSAELFTLAVLLTALGSAWATHQVGLSLALGGFLAGMMLGETEYRHQIEADIRPFRDVLLGLFFITVGMLIDVRLLLAHAWQVTALLASLVVFKFAIIALATRVSGTNLPDAVRTGLVLAQGGEFGFALLTLGLVRGVISPEIGQPLLATIVFSMVLSPFLIRHSGTITRWLFRGRKDAVEDVSDLEVAEQAADAIAVRDHVIICGYGRVGQNLARILDQEGFEFLALDLEPLRVRKAREGGDPVHYGDASRIELLRGIGLDHATAVAVCVPETSIAERIVRAVRQLRQDVPLLVRSPDDVDLEMLAYAGATEIVPEKLEGSLLLASHLLHRLRVPRGRVERRLQFIRNHRYATLREIYRKDSAPTLDPSHAFREELTTVLLVPGAYAVGRTVADITMDNENVTITAIKRNGVVGNEPTPETRLKENDLLVLFGDPEALARYESELLAGS